MSSEDVSSNDLNLSELRKKVCEQESLLDELSDTIRSVGMSVNVANSVLQPVNHLIHITAGFALQESVKMFQDTNNEMHFGKPFEIDDLCSKILPSQNNIVQAVVLSQWDDIVGPQTMHVWLQDNFNSSTPPSEASLSTQEVYKAVHYVTCHTVNCISVSAASTSSSSIYVVPDLKLVAVSQLFHVQRKDSKSPLSLAIVAHNSQYSFIHQRYQAIESWLKRLVQRLTPIFEKSHFYLSEELDISNSVTILVIELNNAVITTSSACVNSLHWENVDVSVLAHSVIPQALTSHLQTFGCTVVIGVAASQINSIIKFLSLFLEEEEVNCSRLVSPSSQSKFNLGLYLQGLLLTGFGYRELSSKELTANRYPVTVLDLTRTVEEGAVKQTPLYHEHVTRQNARIDAMTGSILRPVRESSKLVTVLLRDLALLPLCHWKQHIQYFKKKVVDLAYLLISIVRKCEFVDPEKAHQTAINQFKKCLSLSEGDYYIILAQGEKLKPGLYSLVMGTKTS